MEGEKIKLSKFLEALLYSISKKETMPELAHLGINPITAVKQYFKNNLAQKRIKSNTLKGKIWIVVALPKSASSVIGSMLGRLARERGLEDRGYADYMLANQDSNLRPELVRSFLSGGVLKFHPWAKGNNLGTIEKLGMKVILTLRHPADQIVAYLEHAKKQQQGKVVSPAGLIRDPIYSMWNSQISGSIEDALSFLIKNGYLLNVLMFVTEWLQYREFLNISVLTFEEMVENRIRFYQRISRISEVSMNKKIERDLDSIALSYEEARLKEVANGTAYEKGWTGKVGIYREYFTEKNISEYNEYINKIGDIIDLKILNEIYDLNV